ncbi:hypothetical protein AB1N83_012367 [Pleurotus pulmonarius]
MLTVIVGPGLGREDWERNYVEFETHNKYAVPEVTSPPHRRVLASRTATYVFEGEGSRNQYPVTRIHPHQAHGGQPQRMAMGVRNLKGWTCRGFNTTKECPDPSTPPPMSALHLSSPPRRPCSESETRGRLEYRRIWEAEGR